MNKKTLKTVTAAVMTAAGVLLPQAFHAIPGGGQIFLPMHIPVLMCGMLCGWAYGALCGGITPVLSWALFGMPVAPNALVPMFFELITYGIAADVFYKIFEKKSKKKRTAMTIALPFAMICGRITAIAAKLLLLSVFMHSAAKDVLVAAGIAGFITCWPGILIQLSFIPALISVLDSNGILKSYIDADNNFAETGIKEKIKQNEKFNRKENILPPN